ncbi:competence protein [Siminovitchia fortis]|uniref:Competence protein n=1 Tax=Siminovitchia fortis TaxID=254758 RepID=A0A443J268_9BACI|nr:competence protein [Siminovitchia fortis]RWR14532.1 competence protein [Siminovitchia fortis]WHY83572.1 competence protein [Siminovitchia fortis]
MAKNSKSRRFTNQGKNSVEQHAQRFPYRSTLDEAEKEKIEFMKESSLGGI